MADVPDFDNATPKRRAKPVNGKCECCGDRVGRAGLKWHHCHDCDEFVAYLCNDCNLSLTEHAIRHWDRLAAIHNHPCSPTPTLFTVEATRAQPLHSMWTRPLFLSNGGGDDRYITVSRAAGFITVEQLAAVCGVNANTARDVASGRHNGRGIGIKHGTTWLVAHDGALAYLEARWRMK